MKLIVDRIKKYMLIESVRRWSLLLLPLLVLLIFATDFLTPPGYSHGVLYILPVMSSVLMRSFRVLVITTLIVLVFNIGAGIYLCGVEVLSEELRTIVFWNRLGSVSMIMLAAVATALMLLFVGELQHEEQRLNSALTEMKDNERLLDIAAETLRFGGWSYDTQKKRFRSSRIVREIHGHLSENERNRSTVLNSYAPEFREQISLSFSKCLEEGVPYDMEVQIIRADNGERVWVRATGKPIVDENGRITGINGSFSDLTEAKRLRSKTERMSFRLRTLLDHAGSAIVGLDDNGVVTFANVTAEELLGRESVSMNGESFYKIVNPVNLEGIDIAPEDFGVNRSLTASSASEVRTDEEIFTTADGKRVPVSYVSVRIQHPEFGGAVVVIEDISERIELEDKLRRAQRLKTVGELTGGIAHDFNNLLTLILGNSDLMVEELDQNPELKEMAAEIYQCAEDGAKLTHQLMSFAGQQSLASAAHDINELIRSMVPLLKRSIGENIAFDFEFAESPDLVEVDARQLENAVVELCLNAARAMPQGGDIRIETSTITVNGELTDARVELSPGRYVLLSVSDTGCGISAEEIDRVFEPFYTTKDMAKGEGLGLSMVYGFVKQSGGRVSLYSEQGSGTVVRIYLPTAKAVTGRSMHDVETIDDGLHGKGVLLVVDDNPQVLKFTSRRLKKFGYTVITADCGKAALDILKERDDVDMLFTDVVMQGGMNGKELVEEALALRPELKYGFTSGFTAKVLSEDGSYHTHKLITKPFNKEELGTFIKRMLADVPEER